MQHFMLDPAKKIGCLLCLLFQEHLHCVVSVKPHFHPCKTRKHVQQGHRHGSTQNTQWSSSLSYNHSRCPIFSIHLWNGHPFHLATRRSEAWLCYRSSKYTTYIVFSWKALQVQLPIAYQEQHHGYSLAMVINYCTIQRYRSVLMGPLLTLQSRVCATEVFLYWWKIS